MLNIDSVDISSITSATSSSSSSVITATETNKAKTVDYTAAIPTIIKSTTTESTINTTLISETLSTTPKTKHKKREWIHYYFWMYLAIGFYCMPKCE